MTYRLIGIVAGAAAFALMFSLLVREDGRVIRPDAPSLACQDRAGGCGRPLVR